MAKYSCNRHHCGKFTYRAPVTVGQNGNCNISRQACRVIVLKRLGRDWDGTQTSPGIVSVSDNGNNGPKLWPLSMPCITMQCMLSATFVMCQLDLYLGFYVETPCLQLCLLFSLFKVVSYMTMHFQIALITHKIVTKTRAK